MEKEACGGCGQQAVADAPLTRPPTAARPGGTLVPGVRSIPAAGAPTQSERRAAKLYRRHCRGARRSAQVVASKAALKRSVPRVPHPPAGSTGSAGGERTTAAGGKSAASCSTCQQHRRVTRRHAEAAGSRPLLTHLALGHPQLPGQAAHLCLAPVPYQQLLHLHRVSGEQPSFPQAL